MHEAGDQREKAVRGGESKALLSKHEDKMVGPSRRF
jgi:hypothetical protein